VNHLFHSDEEEEKTLDFPYGEIDYLNNHKHKFSIPKMTKLVTKLASRIHPYVEEIFHAAQLEKDALTYMNSKASLHIALLLTDTAEEAKVFNQAILERYQAKPLTMEVLKGIIKLAAGNQKFIKKKLKIPRTHDSHREYWVPVFIQNVEQDNDNIKLLLITIQIESGIYAGEIFTKKFPYNYITCILKQIGYPKYKAGFGQDLFNTKFSICLKYDKAELKFDEFRTSSSQLNHNKAIFKGRLEDRPCHLRRAEDCADCPYGLDRCVYACKKLTKYKGKK